MAQGTIRIRCKVCRRLKKEGQAIEEKNCTIHKERTYQALFVTPAKKQISATYYYHTDKEKPTALKQAELWIAEQSILYAKNPQYQKPEAITFDKYADQYLEKHKNSSVGAMSFTGYESIIKNHLKPALGGQLISTITPLMVQRVRDSAAAKSKDLRDKVNRHLRGIFREAKLEGFILNNPSESLKKPGKSKKIIYEILNPPQIKDLLHQADRPYNSHCSKNPHISNLFLELYYLLPIYAGLRASEVAGLGRDHCQVFDKPYKINIRRKIRYFNNKKEETYAKAHPQEGISIHGRWWMGEGPEGLKSPAAYRSIPIPQFLAKKLQEFFLIQPENPNNLVFATKEGDPIDHRIMSRIHFRRHRKAAGVPTIKYHELRHTYCSILIKDGLNRGVVDLKRIQKWMGHDEKDIKVTWGIYTQIIDDAKDDSAVAESFAAYIDAPQTVACVTPLSL